MSIDWEPLKEIIAANQRFVLSSHVRPDADAIGSEIGMAFILESLGKQVTIVNPSEVPANLEFLDPARRLRCMGTDITLEQVIDHDVHMILDTSAWGQLLDVGKALRKSSAKKVCIDHHVSSDRLGATEFKDTKAEATGALIAQFAEFMNLKFDATTATALYCAIATDTGWFRFPSTTSGTMRIVADLIDFGAQPNLIYNQLYEKNSLARVRLRGRALHDMKTVAGGRLGYVVVTQKDFAELGAVQADTEEIVNECLKIAGTECAFIAVEQQNARIKVSFRSRTSLNVAAIAEKFGGGGHKQASGAMLPGPLDKALETILTNMESALDS